MATYGYIVKYKILTFMKLCYCFLDLKNHAVVNVGHNKGRSVEVCQLPYGANNGDDKLYCKLKTYSSLRMYAVFTLHCCQNL